jgi:class 3 adenylate cyclase
VTRIDQGNMVHEAAMTQPIQDGIYYIVLADLVGSTKFGAQMGDAALTARVSAFVEASKEALKNAKMSANSGRFVKQVGDGVLLLFNHFPDVVQWHMEFHGSLVVAAVHYGHLQARTCVHAGEVRFENGDASALAVNQVFKMEKRVRAGDLVLTETARQLAIASLYPPQCEFESFDNVPLDGYPEPVKLHRLLIKADIAFLIDKCRRAELKSRHESHTG